MKLLMTIGEYLARSPVYSLEIPQYLEEAQGVTRDEYFQRGMLQVQRLINAYMQGYFQKRDWDISSLYESKQEEIKDILFEQFQFMHENQIWFVKSNDITYSTAGQQTFTYSTNLDDNNFSLIPNHIKRMILNTHLLDYANGEFETEDRAIVYDNQFSDGIFVPRVAWSDKADNTMLINGQNIKLNDVINDLRRTKISIDNDELVHALKITNLITDNNTDNITLKNRIISSNQYYGNKEDNDFAQVKDLRDVWVEADKAIKNNAKAINNATGLISKLNSSKLDTSTATNLLANKANLNLKNVNMGIQPTMKYIIVKTDGSIDVTSTSGDLKVIKWTNEQKFLSGQACYIIEEITENQQTKPYAFLYIATDKVGNINKYPKNEPDYWSAYSLPIDLSIYITGEEVKNTYLPLSGNQGMRGDLQMNGNNVTGASNLIEFSNINDNSTGNEILWSSSKIQNELNNLLNKSTPTFQIFQGVVNWLNQQIFALGIDVRYNNSTINSLITTESNGDLKLASNSGIVKDKNNANFITTNSLDNYLNKYVQKNKIFYAAKGEVKMYSSKAEFDAIKSKMINPKFEIINSDNAFVSQQSKAGSYGIGTKLNWKWLPRFKASWFVKRLDGNNSIDNWICRPSDDTFGYYINDTPPGTYILKYETTDEGKWNSVGNNNAPENWNKGGTSMYTDVIQFILGNNWDTELFQTDAIPRYMVYAVKFTIDTYLNLE